MFEESWKTVENLVWNICFYLENTWCWILWWSQKDTMMMKAYVDVLEYAKWSDFHLMNDTCDIWLLTTFITGCWISLLEESEAKLTLTINRDGIGVCWSMLFVYGSEGIPVLVILGVSLQSNIIPLLPSEFGIVVI